MKKHCQEQEQPIVQMASSSNARYTLHVGHHHLKQVHLGNHNGNVTTAELLDLQTWKQSTSLVNVKAHYQLLWQWSVSATSE